MNQTFLQRVRLPKQKSSIAPAYVWTNADQDPVPYEKRTWTATTFVLYWFSDLVTISTWAAASSVVTLGLSPTDAVWISLTAAFCNAIATVINGAVGADLHIVSPLPADMVHNLTSEATAISRCHSSKFWLLHELHCCRIPRYSCSFLVWYPICRRSYSCHADDHSYMAFVHQSCESLACLSWNHNKRHDQLLHLSLLPDTLPLDTLS